MCCRYYMEGREPDGKLAAIVDMMEKNWPGAYRTGEIFPGDTAPAIIAAGGKIKAVPAVFGFPGFENGKLLLNARSETAASKHSFAESLRSRRIILPATEFYEWSRGSDRTKYSFRTGSDHALYLCGIYRVVEDHLCFVILTREAEGPIAEIHDRMPVIASESEVRPYLTDYESALAIIAAEAPELIRENAKQHNSTDRSEEKG